MSDGVQPGTKIDPKLWERFRQDIKARKGGVRGHVQTELENAIRQYLGEAEPASARQINNRLSRIESELGVSATDGGTTPSEAEPHTHAQNSPSVVEKPAANQSTDKKVEYLAGCLLDKEVPKGDNLVSVSRDSIRDVVKAEYGFRRDTAKRYVEQVVDWFDLRPHPTADNILVSRQRHDELLEQQREQMREDADDELENL